MSSNICPTAGFLAAAKNAISDVPPEIAHTADAILIDLESFRPPCKTLDVHGHEVVLTQQHVSLTVQYGPHAQEVKQGVLGIFTRLPEFECLPAAWHHRI